MRHRRKLVIALGAGMLAAPFASLGQPRAGRIFHIGFLGASSASEYASRVDALRRGLRELGYTEGNNIVMTFRWAEGKYGRLPELAAELANLNVDVIVTHATLPTAAAKKATRTIPIVMAAGGDPVAAQLVDSLARPGGNVTGSTNFSRDFALKRMEALKETFPHLTRVAGLFNSTNLGDEPQAQFKQMEIAAKSMKIELHQFLVQGTGDFNNTFSAMAKRRIEGVVINEDPLLIGNAKAIAEIAAQHRIPLAGFIEIADAGGLIAYGVNNVELWRRAGSFVDRILKGANPGEMPIEQATKFEFVLNMKTAKALGIKIPQSILVRADRVIE